MATAIDPALIRVRDGYIYLTLLVEEEPRSIEIVMTRDQAKLVAQRLEMCVSDIDYLSTY